MASRTMKQVQTLEELIEDNFSPHSAVSLPRNLSGDFTALGVTLSNKFGLKSGHMLRFNDFNKNWPLLEQMHEELPHDQKEALESIMADIALSKEIGYVYPEFRVIRGNGYGYKGEHSEKDDVPYIFHTDGSRDSGAMTACYDEFSTLWIESDDAERIKGSLNYKAKEGALVKRFEPKALVKFVGDQYDQNGAPPLVHKADWIPEDQVRTMFLAH